MSGMIFEKQPYWAKCIPLSTRNIFKQAFDS